MTFSRPGVPAASALLFCTVWLLSLSGCTSESKSGSGGPTAANGDSEPPAEVFEQLESFDPPPLAEIEEGAEWIDLPVVFPRKRLRERLEDLPATISEEDAIKLKNASEESNAQILSAFSQLPASDDKVDWDATFIHHTGADANSLNPLLINSTTEMELLELTGMQLIGYDVEFNSFAVGDLVKSWQTRGDRMMDKFILRDDLTWSDGRPVTAHDIAFTFQAIMNPKTPIPAVRSQTAKLRWVHAYDDHTLVIFHKEPMASWTENLAFPMLPKHIYEKSLLDDPTMLESDYHLQFEKKPVTCGPYEYVSRVRGQEIVMRRRESYYMQDGKQVRDKPFMKEIRFRVITDPNTTLLALKNGDVHEARVTAEQWLTQTEGNDFYNRNTKLQGIEWTEFHIEWNCKDPRFSDPRVRKAMACSLDYEEMLTSVFYNLVSQGLGVFHPDGWMASKNIEPYKQDLDRAEKLLDEAGWTDSDGDGIRDKMVNGRLIPFEFNLISYQTPNAIKACTLLKENLDQIGVICNVKPTEFTVKADLAIKHKFQALMGGWGTGTDPSTLDNIFVTGAGRNHSQYSNSQVDKLFKQAEREFDRDKRAALYSEIHEILFEDQPSLWLFHRKSLYGVNKRLRGFNFSPRDPYGVQPGMLGLWFPKQ